MTFNIPNMFKETFTAYRRAAGSYVSGRWVDGAESSFTVTGSSQPLIGAELNAQMLIMPEGERRRELRKFYTDDTLRPVGEAPDNLPADQIEISGDRFEVHTVHNHTANNNSHSKLILLKVNT